MNMDSAKKSQNWKDFADFVISRVHFKNKEENLTKSKSTYGSPRISLQMESHIKKSILHSDKPARRFTQVTEPTNKFESLNRRRWKSGFEFLQKRAQSSIASERSNRVHDEMFILTNFDQSLKLKPCIWVLAEFKLCILINSLPFWKHCLHSTTFILTNLETVAFYSDE